MSSSLLLLSGRGVSLGMINQGVSSALAGGHILLLYPVPTPVFTPSSLPYRHTLHGLRIGGGSGCRPPSKNVMGCSM